MQPTIQNISKEDILWVAGLLEGEGCFTLGTKAGGTRKARQLRLTCSMTDKDVILRLQTLVGGNVYLERRNKTRPQHKPLHVWSMTRRAQVVPLLEKILPHMGQRRTQRIVELLEYAQQFPPLYNNPQHGTKTMYSYHGCRCTDCRKAVADYTRKLREKRRQKHELQTLPQNS